MKFYNSNYQIQHLNFNHNKEREILEKLRDKPFWIWDKTSHEREYDRTKGLCCFNHSIPAGLPLKDNVRKPIYNWQKQIVDAFTSDSEDIPFYQRHHLALLKARGSGGSEIGIRLMMWLATKDQKLSGHQMAVMTGNSTNLAVGLINRCKELFTPSLVFDTRESLMEINNVKIEAFPSHRIEGLRGLHKLAFALADECSSWPMQEQQEVLDTVIGYVGKMRNFHLFFLSTAGYPGDIMDKIFKQKEEACIFQRLRIDWTAAVGTTLNKEDVDKIRLTERNTFEREYALKASGFAGNCYTTATIDAAIKSYPADVNVSAGHISMGVDVGFSSSATGICLTQWRAEDKKVYVIHTEEIQKADYEDVISRIIEHIHYYKPVKIFIDASSPEVIRSLCGKTGFQTPEMIKKQYLVDYKIPLKKFYRPDDKFYSEAKIVPIAFQKHGRDLLVHTKLLFQKNRICIDPRHEKLIASLGSAYEESGLLNKTLTAHDDVYEAAELSLRFFKFGGSK